MGVCPQHDVLFDNLTPEEHLDIFYDFKGGDPKRKKEELKESQHRGCPQQGDDGDLARRPKS